MHLAGLSYLNGAAWNMPAFSPPADASTCFLESIMGLTEPAAEALAPFVDGQLFEDTTPASLVEPVPV